MVEVRYYRDVDSGLPHMHRHGITEAEVEHVLAGPGEDLPGSQGARMKLGQTAAERISR